ncbi:hypothetical protein [Sphingomonas sp. 28-63-12]|uniref:hypothetical protein n=1 Tax=Sphingomonas sp. 28-63-12 TaxID=1970434 RepID=UPI0035A97616
MRAQLVAMAGLIVLASCAPSPDQAADKGNATAVVVSVAGPDRVVVAGALPTPELDGVTTTPGHWRRDSAPAGDAAVFVDQHGQTQFAMRCDRAAHRLLFVRAAPAGDGGMLKIITGSGAASFVARPRRFAPGAMAAVPFDDSFVTAALATASGRIGVMLTGSAAPNRTLAIPADAMIGGVIGDCRANYRAQSS